MTFERSFALSKILPEIGKILSIECSVIIGVVIVITLVPSAFSQTTNNDPMFPSSETGERSVDENTLSDVNIGSPVAATDADNDNLIYSIDGDDAEFFNFDTSNGQLSTKDSLNYEAKPSYTLSVSVSDQKDALGNSDTEIDAEIDVTITINNVDEAGIVFLFPEQPRVGSVIQVRLSDPDGITGLIKWEWYISSDKSNWQIVSDGYRDNRTPIDLNRGKYIRTIAFYTDGESSSEKTAEGIWDHIIESQELAPKISVVTLVSNLNFPWDIAFTPDETMLFTERGGKLSSRLTDGTIQTVTADFSDLHVGQNNGLMGIVVDPNFTSNRRFYTCQGHIGQQVQIIAWTINSSYTTATRVNDPLVGGIPSGYQYHHTGCRLRFGPEGYLWIATGDGFLGTTSQDLTSLAGKVLRVDALTGIGAPTNPFPSLPKVYTYGHRNPQGLALRSGTNQMWLVEHGPFKNDEINLLSSGGNYGWYPGPNEESNNLYNEHNIPMTDLVKYPDAVEAKWSSGKPTLATSGGIFLEGEDWGEWKGRLAVAMLKNQSLHIFDFSENGTLVDHLIPLELDEQYGRLRTPMIGPDGALYVTTSNGNGQDRILKVVPGEAPEFSTETNNRYEVEENNNSSIPIATVMATDLDGTPLSYSLSGPDAGAFIIPNAAVGELWSNTNLDYEVKSSYKVIITATDQYGLNGSITLTIIVTDVNEVPEIVGESNVRYIEEGAGIVYTYMATDPEKDSISWTKSRKDASLFSINNGTLRFLSSPDFENPIDEDGNNIYEVLLEAFDGQYTDSIYVSVTVVDAGSIALSSMQPQVGTPLIATLIEPDAPASDIVWYWKRGLDESSWDIINEANTETYSPNTNDINYYLRAQVSYTDSAGTRKDLENQSTEKVVRRPTPPPPPTTGGGSRTGGGGGGGAPTSRDQHGNTVSRAADVTLDDLMSSTPAVINSRTDVDYFSFDILNDGLFLVNTTGSAHTTGKMWQQVDGELELLSEGEDTGSLGRNFEMKSKVKAGTVIVLVEGKNQRTGSYNLHTDLILGYLENPGPGSKKSGVGVISGWTCDAEDVEVEIDGTRVMRAAYGTERLDTEVVCEDTDNGFGLLFNWNLLDRSQKEHTARLLVDGEELDKATFTVTTLGEEFVRGVSGETRVNDFPSVGEMFRLVWQQALQNFTLAPLELPEIGKKPRASLPDGVLENPHHASLQSGIGVISGWICDAESVHVEIDGEKNYVVSYGTERTDTMGVCGDTNNGFGLLINWNNLEDGVHTAKLFADGEVVDETQFVVTNLGQEFLRGAQKTVKVTDFPEGGQETTLEWQQNEQNFMIIDVSEKKIKLSE